MWAYRSYHRYRYRAFRRTAPRLSLERHRRSATKFEITHSTGLCFSVSEPHTHSAADTSLISVFPIQSLVHHILYNSYTCRVNLAGLSLTNPQPSAETPSAADICSDSVLDEVPEVEEASPSCISAA